MRPLQGRSLECDRPFFIERSAGVAPLRYHGKHSATGVLLHLSRGRGGILSGHSVRDAEMTIKIIFERSNQKGGVGRGFEKRVDRGPS